ncbi:MAG: hypothetical protein H7222_01350 [Methylotenera sp.]|nr:hypothetical protein [Oligoflexia bacterium]
MPPLKNLSVILCTLLGLAVASSQSSAAQGKPTANSSEIKVTLFEQPCLLSGPVDRSILTAIHSISPEKIPVLQSPEQLKKALETLRGVQGLPAAVDQYKEHLKKRMMALIAFQDSIGAARKKANIDLFLANVREHVFESKVKDFETQARKISEKTSTPWSGAFVDQLKTLYESVVQPHPEEEFHRAIQISNIHYTCAFDDGGEKGPNSVSTEE